MSKSKLPKRRKGHPRQAAPKTWWTPIRKLWTGIATVISFGSVLLAYTVFVPRITVEAGSAYDVTKPTPMIFNVTNTGWIALNDVRGSLGVCEFGASDAGSRRPLHECRGALRSFLVFPNWSRPRLGMDEKLTIVIDDGIKLPAVSESGNISADISIKMTYAILLLPWTQEREFRFIAKKQRDGLYYWFSEPL